jgi:hypothetical protein
LAARQQRASRLVSRRSRKLLVGGKILMAQNAGIYGHRQAVNNLKIKPDWHQFGLFKKLVLESFHK